MKRTRLNPVSAKRRSQLAQLADARAEVVFRSYGRCEANTPACPPREHEGVHVHHVKQRSAGGGHDPANLLNVCLAAHEYVHAHPEESFAKGWLIQSWTPSDRAE